MRKDKSIQIIGFDAKRAAQNRTGLGNYSRFVVQGLCRYASSWRLLLYAPHPRKTTALNGLDKEASVAMRYPTTTRGKCFRSLWRVWGMTSDLQRDGVQLFHGLSNELPLTIGRASNIKTVVTIHDLIFLRYPQYYKPVSRWIYHYKFRRACRVADRIIAVSECTKRDIIHFFGTPADRISVIYQGCDDQFRQPATAAKKAAVRERYQLPKRYILYVGSIEERKNLKLLAEAMGKIDDETLEEVEVIAVGRRTRYADDVSAYLRSYDAQHPSKCSLASRFRMLSGVPFADLPALYQMADVFVYPSRFEGFGIPMLEALCSGVPAIGCTGSCLEEAGGPSSLYVDPDDAQALASAITRILTDDALRARMIADGYRYADRFTQEVLTKQLVALYAQVML